MPSKRQPSKQRRAAQNRAQREALAARREHASQAGRPPARPSATSSGAKAAGDKPRRPGLLSSLTGTGGGTGGAAPARPVRPMGGIGGRIMGDTAAEPGARGVLLAVPLAIAAFVYQVGFYTVPVDDRGEVVPIGATGTFRGLYIATREALTGRELDLRDELASSVAVDYVVTAVLALVVVLGVFFLFRYRRPKSMYWTVTIGMLLLAVTVLLRAQTAFIGAMGAMTWASFQIRRAELPAKMAEREAVRAARAEAAAAEKADEEDEYDEDAYEEEAYDEEAYEEEAYEEGDEDAEAEADEDDGTEYDEDAYDEEAYEEEAYEEDDEYEDDDEVDDDADADAEAEAEDEPAASDEAEAEPAASDEAEAEPAASDEDENEPAAAASDEPGNGAAPTEAAGPDERIVDYDEDILKELEAEIDESEKGGGSGSSPR